MAEVDQSEARGAPCEGVVLLGIKSGRPHAARFSSTEAGLAAKAVKLMGLHLVVFDNAEKVAAADEVARGKIFSSGNHSVRTQSNRPSKRLPR